MATCARVFGTIDSTSFLGTGVTQVRGLGLVILAACVLLLAGCASSGDSKPVDPEIKLKDPKYTVRQRVDAVQEIWDRGQESREATRERLKNLAWRVATELDVRLKVMQVLLDDPKDVNNEDTRKMFALMLPTEPAYIMVDYICETMAERGWKEAAPALVRAWARPTGRLDPERAERKALVKLFPNQPVEQTVYSVFATPPTGSGLAKERAEAARTAAWEVLTRLDPDGSKRRAALSAEAASDDPLLADLQAAAKDLRVMPLTGSQLGWLREMRRFDATGTPWDGDARKRWWGEVTTTVAGLAPEQAQALGMRNLEAIRSAKINRPNYLRATRAQLLDDLGSRIKGRKTWPRVGVQENGTTWGSEELSDNQGQMTWADLLTVLMIDDQVQLESIRAELWEQILRDIKDTTTELGGLVEYASPRSLAYTVTLYPPRPTMRRGDQRYVAPEEMFVAGPTALAHYHFHAQRINNREYSGPGPGDAEFARDQGRACLVITPVGDRRFNIDYYQATPKGPVTIDLGEFAAPATSDPASK